ncbi:MAG: tRNA (adenosine(37)-N6)-threonylcarbamoyltransferase complex dimerization subunit type 1 TsaB [Chloroflexota bacterium]
MSHDGRRTAVLAIDTATSQVLVATGTPEGDLTGLTTWAAGYRHGETLLPTIARHLGENNLRRSRLAGIIVGTGPGAFTGLRVGIATAKGLAHGLGRPIVGVSTGEALLAAAAWHEGLPIGAFVLLLPAGPTDRVVVRHGASPSRLPGGTEPEIEIGERLVAVDLDGRAPRDAVARGTAARDRLGAELVRIGADRLARGEADDLAELVPEYVTLPRGVAATSGEVSWSHDLR